MTRTDAIDRALEAWRAAERQRARTFVGDTAGLTREVERRRDEYQRLSTEHIFEWMAAFDRAWMAGFDRAGIAGRSQLEL